MSFFFFLAIILFSLPTPPGEITYENNISRAYEYVYSHRHQKKPLHRSLPSPQMWRESVKIKTASKPPGTTFIKGGGGKASHTHIIIPQTGPKTKKPPSQPPPSPPFETLKKKFKQKYTHTHNIPPRKKLGSNPPPPPHPGRGCVRSPVLSNKNPQPPLPLRGEKVLAKIQTPLPPPHKNKFILGPPLFFFFLKREGEGGGGGLG